MKGAYHVGRWNGDGEDEMGRSIHFGFVDFLNVIYTNIDVSAGMICGIILKRREKHSFPFKKVISLIVDMYLNS